MFERLRKALRGHEHRWTHMGKPVERLAEVPESAMFYRLDCECGKSIDGALTRRIMADSGAKDTWLLRALGFKPGWEARDGD